MKGNREHRKQLAAFGHTHLPKKISTLVLACSDARLGGMLDFDDFAKEGVAVVYVAGNVADVLKAKGMKEMLSHLDKDARVLVLGHSKCGAVKCAHEASSASAMKKIFKKANIVGRRVTRNLDALVGSVHPEGENANLARQVEVLRTDPAFTSIFSKKNIRVISAIADFTRTEPKVEIIDGSSANEKDAAFVFRLQEKYRRTNSEVDFSGGQYAHAIVISGPSIFDPRAIFGVKKANEVFCVSSGDFGRGKGRHGEITEDSIASAEMAELGLLDVHATMIGSIEYSVQHLQARNIVLMDTSSRAVEELEAQLLANSPILTSALSKNQIELTLMVYNPQTGAAEPYRHLVNQDAGKELGEFSTYGAIIPLN